MSVALDDSWSTLHCTGPPNYTIFTNVVPTNTFFAIQRKKGVGWGIRVTLLWLK